MLAERGADFNFKHPTEGTLLHIAAGFAACNDMLKFLQELPADTEIFKRVHLDTVRFGATALHTACSLGNVDMVRYAATCIMRVAKPLLINATIHVFKALAITL